MKNSNVLFSGKKANFSPIFFVGNFHNSSRFSLETFIVSLETFIIRPLKHRKIGGLKGV